MPPRRNQGGNPSPLVIYIDDDDADEHNEKDRNDVSSIHSQNPRIKIEQSDDPWWSVEAFPLSPICISDDEDGGGDDGGSGTGTTRPLLQLEMKQEDIGSNGISTAELRTEENEEATTSNGEIASLQPQRNDSGSSNLAGFSPIYEEENTGAEDDEPSLFMDPYETFFDNQVMAPSTDIDSLYWSPSPEPQPEGIKEATTLANPIEQHPEEEAEAAGFAPELQGNTAELYFTTPPHRPETGMESMHLVVEKGDTMGWPAPLVTTQIQTATVAVSASDSGDASSQEDPVIASFYQPTSGLSPTHEPHPNVTITADAHAFSWSNLQAVISSDSPPLMAEAVKVTRPLLLHLSSPLKDIEERIEGPGWTQRITQLQNNAKPTPVFIGVVGRTGAGKSSVINAILDEDRVLPTNGLRACTAVVTEISWNASENEAERYRAEIEFVKSEDWRRELTRLFDDVIDSGDTRDTRDFVHTDSSEANIALAKLRAVFPDRATSRAALMDGCSLQTLLDDAQISSLLGTVCSVTSSNPQSFYMQLQVYLDSSISGRLSGTADAQQQEEMALWPLIKVVRVYLKSDALSTGVVLVDLPGFGDANIARDAVAERYISQCAAIWIVSPITRAVDDREARELLGHSFRRQLVLDGTYSSLSFICSKTDDISIREVAESLDFPGDVRRISADLAAVDQKLVLQMQHLGAVKQQQNQAVRQLDDIMARLDALDAVGRNVLNRQKRAAEAGKHGVSKRAKLTEDANEENKTTEASDPAAVKEICTLQETSAGSPAAADNGAFTATDLNTHGSDMNDMEAGMELELRRLMQEREDAVKQLSSAYASSDRAEEDCRALEHQRDELMNERVAVCMQLRNAYSRAHIKADFAQGQKDIDDESVALADREPPNERKYADLASSLPVFCVSSRAYQRFRGRTGTDDNDAGNGTGSSDSGSLSGLAVGRSADSAPPLGYRHVGETEILQLQQHARRLGTECLARRDRKVLTDLAQLLTSLAVWVSSSAGGFGLQIHLDQERRGYEMRHLEQAYDELKHNLTSAADKFIVSLRRIMETKVLMKQTQVLAKCVDAAPGIAASWSASRRNGGLRFNTYRSICRNRGFPTSSKIRRSFNEELLCSLLDTIAPAWDAAFRDQIPGALSECQAVAEQLIEHFHRRMCNRPILDLCTQNTGLGMLLDHEIRGIKHLFREALELARHHIDTFRRDANRLPLECIHSAMAPVYMTCAQESGAGCMARMRTAMAEHVESCRRAMYASIESAARDRLAVFSDGVLKELLVGHYDSLASLYQDCRNMIVGVEVPETTRTARDFVHKLLQQADAAFAPELLNATEGA